MKPRNRHRVAWLVGLLAGLLIVDVDSRGDEAARPDATTIRAREAIAPASPPLPADVVAAMQERRFATAQESLERMARDAETADGRAYYGLVRGIALRLDGRRDEAGKALAAALEAAPKGRWSGKIRFELAGFELAGGHPESAEAAAREQAVTLLATERKDRLAEVYHAFARRLLKPGDPIAPPDPKGAYELLVQARGLAKGELLRARLLLAMAEAAQAAGNHAQAIANLQAYLKQYPHGEDRSAARYHLGEAQRDASQVLAARLTWTDLAHDLAQAKRPLTKDEEQYRAKALYEIPRTHGVPNPPNDSSLGLGVAALRRFLAAYPAHPLAVRAAYEIGESYLVRGKSQEAIEALRSFLEEDGARAETDEAKRDLSRLSMTATFQIGQILQGQEKFAEAIAAWKGYLAKFPNGPQSADAQRAILDTQLMIAADHLRREQFGEARTALQAFVAQNPLDARVPQAVFQAGESFVTEKEPDKAIAAWEPLLSKFPDSEPAAHAQFVIASIYENEKGDPAAAIDRFKKIAAEPWKSQAAQRVAVMEAKALTVITPRAFRSGEHAHLKITTRNLESLTFTAYKLDAEAYFRKKHSLNDVEALDIGLVQPDAEWVAAVPGYAKYKPVEKEYALEKLKVPGVYVVKVTDEKSLQATTLVLGSDLDALVKSSREQLLVFAQDMKSGKGRPGARVLVSDGGEVILEARTGKDGVLLKSWDKPRDPNSSLRYLVLDGADTAGSGLNVPERVAQGITARAYLSTDRPAYRPGQRVELRGVVREVKDGQYAYGESVVYRLEVSDSRGRRIVARPVTLSAFGTFHESLPLDEGAPIGTYRVRLYHPGGSDFAGQFEVQAYQLQKLDLAFDLKQTIYFRGETIETDLIARYQYGAPASNRPINVQLPDGRILHGTTNADGKYHVSFPTEGFSEEQTLSLAAQLPQDGVGVSARVLLAVRAYTIGLRTTRDVYLDGETFPLDVTTEKTQGGPTGQEVTIAVYKQVVKDGRVSEREVLRKPLSTDKTTGQGTVSLKVDDDSGGRFVVRAAGTDRFGSPVVAERTLTISGKEDETKLRILADRQSFKVGEEASVTLHNRRRAGTVLVAWEADRILSYRLVELQEGENPLTWAIDGVQFPNFTLTASKMSGTHFDEARLDVRVERMLRVAIEPTKRVVGPGDEVEVAVTTTDQMGRPVSAEVALALVDRALLRLYEEHLPPIGDFFYGQTRTGAFATEVTNTFRYAPATSPVSEAVVEEMERQEEAKLDDKSRGMPAARKRREAAEAEFAPAPATPPTAEGLPFGYAPAQQSSGAERPLMRNRIVGGIAPPVGLSSDARDLGIGESPVESGERESKLPAQPDAGQGQNWQLGFTFQMPVGMRRKLAADRAAQPRQRFVETAYWNPGIVTDKAGKATVKFRAPLALSRYRFSARGVSGADTLVGQTDAELRVRKDFFVDLKLPAALTEGDRPRFLAQVHHEGATGRIDLRLTVYAGGKETVFPRTVEVKADGVDEVLFEPFEVPDGDVVRLSLSAALGDVKDELVSEVPIRPWGVQAFASASGTASDDATVFVGLPPGRPYENPEMLVTVSPSLRRMLVELAVGREAYPLPHLAEDRIVPIPSSTIADRAADLVAASQVLAYLRGARADDAGAPEAERISERIRSLVAELIALQNEDGGWPWVVGDESARRQGHPSDRATSAVVAWSLASAKPLGLLTDPSVPDRAAKYLTQEFARVAGGDHDTRALLLHALSTLGKATFEQANSLNRVRQGLSDAALADLALTLHNLDRAPMAGEVLDILVPRAKLEPVAPGFPPRRYWQGQGTCPIGRGPVQATALAALALARVRPQASELGGAVEWLLAHRHFNGWYPHQAKGPALAALAAYYGDARAAEDRYRLTVTVNDATVMTLEALGNAASKAVLVPRKALKAGAPNRIHFDVEGRGTFGYAVTLTGFTRDFGPDQTRTGRAATIDRRVYAPVEPELDGKPLPSGFSTAINASMFENRASQVALGARARVEIDASRYQPPNQPIWERDFLVVEEHLPAGTTLVDGSVQTQAGSYTLADGVLTFYFAPHQWPGRIRYDVFGFLPGRYRALPASIRSAYEPGRSHLGTVGELRVLSPNEANTDPYKPTPDELFARGKADFEAGRLDQAAQALEPLFGGYTLRDDIAKEAARMLLLVSIRRDDPRKIVQYFEVVKEKAPEMVVTFDDLMVIGKAYRDIREFERAYLVWRGVIEASYLEDARVGEVLRQRGKPLEGMAYLIGLWREYPNTPSISSDFFALSQVLARQAVAAANDPVARRILADAGVTRSELLAQSIRLVQTFLAMSPRDPMADEASLALLGSFLELEDFETVVRLSERFAGLYPRSTFLDSFQYSEALGDFHLGRYDRAIAVAEAISKATYKDAAGVDQPSPNKWQAVYILGQIHDARRQPGQALSYYEQVAERFSDAAGAVKALTRKALKLPEVTVVRPTPKAAVAAGERGAAGRGLRAVPPRPADDPKNRPKVELDYRNIAEADVKVYPVDLMRLYLTRRNLDAIAGIDLAGITPLREETIKLGSGADFDDKARSIALSLDKEGAYLVMVRGDSLYASGILLVSPLELEVLEEADAGRVRVRVRDATTKDPVPKVQVKVIGSEDGDFRSGESDLRGVFVAENLHGEVTAVARQGAARYAFYRGTAHVGQAATAPAPSSAPEANKPRDAAKALDENLKDLNSANQLRQIERLEKRMQQGGQGGANAVDFR